MSVPDDPPVEAPVAVKLYTMSASVWLVAGAPTDAVSAMVALEAEDFWLGHDEVMVVFDDEIAARIGLLETITVSSVPERVRRADDRRHQGLRRRHRRGPEGFAGPARKFAYDSHLFSFGESLGLQSGTS